MAEPAAPASAAPAASLASAPAAGPSAALVSPAPPTVEAGPAASSSPVTAAPTVEAVPAAPVEAPPASPEPAKAEPFKPGLATTLLAEATAKTAEAPPAAPAEAKPDAAPEAPTAPTYEKFTLPENVTLDDAKLGAFTGLLGEYEAQIAKTPAEAHAATQTLGQKLVDLYIAEKQAEAQRALEAQWSVWQNTNNDWVKQVKSDPEIGGNRFDTTMKQVGAMFDRYGAENGADRETAFRDALKVTGAANHPDIIRFVNWMTKFTNERARPVPAITPRQSIPQSRAARRYAASQSNGAA